MTVLTLPFKRRFSSLLTSPSVFRIQFHSNFSEMKLRGKTIEILTSFTHTDLLRVTFLIKCIAGSLLLLCCPRRWIDVTYMSPKLRISRGNKGTIFVLVKADLETDPRAALAAIKDVKLLKSKMVSLVGFNGQKRWIKSVPTQS